MTPKWSEPDEPIGNLQETETWLWATELSNFMLKRLRWRYDGYHVVGDEDISQPNPVPYDNITHREKRIIAVDALDGRANFLKGSLNFATTIGTWDLGVVVIKSTIRQKNTGKLTWKISGGIGRKITINDVPARYDFKPYDPANMRLLYNTGEMNTREEQKKFVDEVRKLTDRSHNLRCLSLSIFEIMRGEAAGYISQMENGTTMAPWFNILYPRNTPLVVLVNGCRIDSKTYQVPGSGTRFTLAVVRNEFWVDHLTLDTPLGKLLRKRPA
ncbi:MULTISPECIES: inositol monophosphatase family protein [unclassified Neorhizobium]|uniref:inositol monophosphatase family protein n=1 Tax=unclassified Neorhizobium TaxID=2629175 RepID=UPI001FF53BBD|nr:MULTISPECIES: inositol monophosphatase family protein [unclassified Neorhizobium]MCJ9672151.1 hypothetical protein [Neorhizobium sp. SHOUNA12B]MCJ9748028.1 hypothetical protein [Neorhizobium sp. SHOUNA12A]